MLSEAYQAGVEAAEGDYAVKLAVNPPLKDGYASGKRLAKHVFGGAALGAGVGAVAGDDTQPDGRLEGAIRGGLYGAAGGVGVAHKTNPIMRRRFEELQKMEQTMPAAELPIAQLRKAPRGLGWLQKRLIGTPEEIAAGAMKPKVEAQALADAHTHAQAARLAEMKKLDLGERLTEGTVGGALGLGLGAGAGAVYDRVRGRGMTGSPQQQPPMASPMVPYPQGYYG